MLDFDARLERGPLRVRALWREEQTRSLAKRVRERRRKALPVRAAAGFVCVCSVLYALLVWLR